VTLSFGVVESDVGRYHLGRRYLECNPSQCRGRRSVCSETLCSRDLGSRDLGSRDLCSTGRSECLEARGREYPEAGDAPGPKLERVCWGIFGARLLDREALERLLRVGALAARSLERRFSSGEGAILERPALSSGASSGMQSAVREGRPVG